MGKLLDKDGWEEVRRWKGKAPMHEPENKQVGRRGFSQYPRSEKLKINEPTGKPSLHARVSVPHNVRVSVPNKSAAAASKSNAVTMKPKEFEPKINFTVAYDAQKSTYSDAIKTGTVCNALKLDLDYFEPIENEGNRRGRLFGEAIKEAEGAYGLPKEIEGIDDNGVIYTQEVIYENPPPICNNCVCFGHTIDVCPMVKKWVPKTVDQTEEENSDKDNLKKPDAANNNDDGNVDRADQTNLKDIDKQTQGESQDIVNTYTGSKTVNEEATNINSFAKDNDIVEDSDIPPVECENNKAKTIIAEAIKELLFLQKDLICDDKSKRTISEPNSENPDDIINRKEKSFEKISVEAELDSSSGNGVVGASSFPPSHGPDTHSTLGARKTQSATRTRVGASYHELMKSKSPSAQNTLRLRQDLEMIRMI